MPQSMEELVTVWFAGCDHHEQRSLSSLHQLADGGALARLLVFGQVVLPNEMCNHPDCVAKRRSA